MRVTGEMRRDVAVERGVLFFNDSYLRPRSGVDANGMTGREPGVVMCGEVSVGGGDGALKDVDEGLVRSHGKAPVAFEFDGVLGEVRAEGGRRVDDGRCVEHAGKRGAHEGVGRVEKMIALVAAAGASEMLHYGFLVGVMRWPRVAAVIVPSE